MAYISDHAVLRWLERVRGIDIESVRSEMMQSADVIDKAAAFGCETVVMGNGARLKLQGDVVSTVLRKRHGKAVRHG